MARIHFAGVNTRPLAAAARGHDVLVSYADIRRSAPWWRELREDLAGKRYGRVILDSGAFTVISQGITIDVEEYCAFARENAQLFDVVVNLDDIGGDLARTWRNQRALEAAGVDVMPVYHQDEPIEVLEHYVRRHAHRGTGLGLGFARKPGGAFKYSLKVRRAWLEVVFRRIAGRIDVHGFGMTRHRDEFPFSSVDSTTWIAEYRALGRREGPHRIEPGTEACRAMRRRSKLERMRLVLASYVAPETRAHLAPFVDESCGQARTVFARLAAGMTVVRP